MVSGKIRSKSHMIDEEAKRFISNNLFPSEWVLRTIIPDYGIDFDLELFSYENNQCFTLGEHILLQVKGTKNPKYSKISTFGTLESKNISVIKFSIETSLINLIERMGNAVPVLLLIVDLSLNKVYWLCLNDYIKNVLPYQNPSFKNNKTITIYIPIDNVANNASRNIWLWYGKRSKLYSLFVELWSAIDTIENYHSTDIVSYTKKLIDSYLCYDVWNARKLWPTLDNIYTCMLEMKNNDMVLSRNLDLLTTIRNKNDNIEDPLENVNNKIFYQIYSSNHLIDLIKVANSDFEKKTRHIGLPTDFNYL